MNWYVVYTKPKWEKKVAEQLQKIGVECYCPLVTQMRQWSDRKKKVEVPLFNSYVFVQLEDSKRNLVFQSVGAVRYLYWLGKPAIVRDEEIEVIKKWLNTSDCVDLTVASYQIGETIQLESGPFADQKATVQEMTNTHYVLVLESLGCVLKMKR
ncbi:UpxY family transcription antiterminator [Flavobacterium sp. ZB4P23]|uniref:UpxY family transcription antiterminator n=1 Tax=unclassified Flavobacterium TaxID=196869 RepID=UPI000F843F34|nr:MULTISPECIES: UpxY family transcription antiterminator [unclassified Flavobacterium]RTY95478.1 UpxY family transcription antiterminator [Flavobacterium sp. GSN2]RTY71276.1 UpxY family transcription antiterminator [Flavobacterium sp. LB2P53]RTY76858.1 UpxY family transcription antiterminator [Flavobacterium sp. LS1R10]RTY83269.1 UpxY family transcription antiterminator [Flavobacterium sp. ZB4P23]RTY85579.1 UpxY family transcription antiterminator [Flavobacterium sp. RSP15]